MARPGLLMLLLLLLFCVGHSVPVASARVVIMLGTGGTAVLANRETTPGEVITLECPTIAITAGDILCQECTLLNRVEVGQLYLNRN